jgi:hypothetical protein
MFDTRERVHRRHPGGGRLSFCLVGSEFLLVWRQPISSWFVLPPGWRPKCFSHLAIVVSSVVLLPNFPAPIRPPMSYK